MHHDFQQLMKRAAQLTQSGNPTAATTAIQTALRSGTLLAFTSQNESDVIDVEVREVPEHAEKLKTDTTVPGEKGESTGTLISTNDTFSAGTFRNSSGQRSYKLYVPPNANNQPLPLVVMLHGCTQNADDFAAGTAMNLAARKQGFYVLYPIQSAKGNLQKCWNWFKHNHQQPGRGEPSILTGMTREVMAAHNIDSHRVYVAGLSAGGAMAVILAGAYPDLYAAAGVHSGLAPGVASDLPSALSAMKGIGISAPVQTGSGVPTIVFHGDNDAIVHPNNAQAVIASSVGSSAQFKTLQVSGMNNTRNSTKYLYRNSAGDIIAERWEIHGAGHAWAGGTERGSYTDPTGPDATTEMLRFFFEH